MVHADAVAHQPRQRLAEACGEPERADQVGDGLLVRLAGDVDAGERLRPLHGRGLREVHDVDRRLVGGEQLADGLVQRREHVAVVQRYRALHRGDHGRVAAGAAGEVFLEEADVPERGAHQQELRLRQLDQRHLPCPAAVRVGVEVELVHHDRADVGPRAFAQRDVGEDLRGAADDRRPLVDGGVAGEHADLLRAERLDQLEELLADQRLDRGGVERAVPARRAAAACAPTATSDFPEPVGVERITLLPVTSSISASSCAGYSERPRSSKAQSAKASTRSSGSGVGRQPVGERHGASIVPGRCGRVNSRVVRRLP